MDNRFNKQKQSAMRIRELFSGSRLSGFVASSGTPFLSIVSDAGVSYAIFRHIAGTPVSTTLPFLPSMRMCCCCCMHG
jgi:hypothetical protein